MANNPVITKSIFLNLAHFLDHFFILIYATAVIAIALEFDQSYGEILVYATPGFVLFGAMALPFGWLGDRWGRHRLILIFFVGIGFSSLFIGLSQNIWQIAGGLTAIGLFAAIYHPVGIPMLVQGIERPGRILGINGVFGNLGVAAAPLFVGFIDVQYGWRTAFIVPGILSIVIGGLFWKLVPRDKPRGSKSGPAISLDDVFVPGWRHVLGVIAVIALMGGLIFNSTTISLPKLFEERLTLSSVEFMNYTVMASIAYACASIAQIVTGYAVDRLSAKSLIIGIVFSQALIFVGVAQTDGLPVFFLALLGMSSVFGQIPIIDTLITRYVPDSHRGKVFSVRYLLNLTVGAMAVPLISYLHEWGGGFQSLFLFLSFCALTMAVAATTLPNRVKSRLA